MMSGQAHIEMQCAHQTGAWISEKPVSTEKLLLTVDNVLKLQRLERKTGSSGSGWGSMNRLEWGDDEEINAQWSAWLPVLETRVCILERPEQERTRRPHITRTQPRAAGPLSL